MNKLLTITFVLNTIQLKSAYNGRYKKSISEKEGIHFCGVLDYAEWADRMYQKLIAICERFVPWWKSLFLVEVL